MALTIPVKCKGFTFLGLLATMAIVAIGMAAVGVVWSKAAKREREKELLFIGQAYQSAIGSYYENRTGTAKKQYPQKLEDLLEDQRNGTKTVRHLRKLYQDPMTRGSTWGLIKQQGGIVGVFSTSLEEPIDQSIFEKNQTYQDWVFRFSAGKKANQNTTAAGFNTENNAGSATSNSSSLDGAGNSIPAESTTTQDRSELTPEIIDEIQEQIDHVENAKRN